MSVGMQRRLLIVDDEPEIRTTLAEYFERAGYAVATASDVPEALTKLPQGFEAVLSDIKMPGGSGIEFLREARRTNAGLGVFLITGYPTLETIIDAKQYGAVAYFRKPLKLVEIDSRLRAFLGEDVRSLIDGRLLVVGQDILAQLEARLVRFQTVSCEPTEADFLRVVGAQRPKAILADAAHPGTPALLAAYQRLGRDANSFIVVSDESTLDAANEMLFALGAAGCVALDAPQEAMESAIREAVERRETQKLDQQSNFDQMTNKCMFAKAYRNGYYCLKHGTCVDGHPKAGWIAIEGKEYQKCPKRPLLVESLESVGFVTWAGQLEAARSPELRKQLLLHVREGKREIVIDCQGLQQAHYNLFEILSDVYDEMVKHHPEGLIHIINLNPTLLEQFRKATINRGVRTYGVRMVDERRTFERWGTRFD